MVGGTPEGGIGTSSSLFSFVPRQVMLNSCSVGALEVAEKKKTKKGRKAEQHGEKRMSALLRAIAAFLEGSGFNRTLAALRSEAQLEIEDEPRAPVLDLGDIIFKYVESSKDPPVESIDNPEEQDAQNRAAIKLDESVRDHSEEPIYKEKEKKLKGGDDNVQTESDKFACEKGEVSPDQVVDELLKRKVPEADHESSECRTRSKDQKKKSKKASNGASGSSGNEKPQTLVEEKSKESISLPKTGSSLLYESNIRSKDKKKKKNKLTSEFVNQVGPETSEERKGEIAEFVRKTDGQMPTLKTEDAISENTAGEDYSKRKDKKKRKRKLILERPSMNGVEEENGSKSDSGKKEKFVNHETEEDAKESDQKIEHALSSVNTGNIVKKAKKRKISASEETELHVNNNIAVQESKQRKADDLKKQHKEETRKLDDSLLNSELCMPGEKRKTEKEDEDSEKSAKAPINKQSQVPKDTKEILAVSCGQNTKEQWQSIGNLKRNEQEGNGWVKSNNREFKRSAEPKTVNAFKRVKVDEVQFADEKLQDNSYWAKDGAEIGYGAKAQEILGQVRGRDFRHEKTKKKRGSYRGGQIDFQSHSVKFKYSDDDE